MFHSTPRRQFLFNAAGLSAAYALPLIGRAQTAPASERSFSPQVAGWRTFDVTTRVDVQQAFDGTRVWLPVPSIDTEWQRSLDHSWTSNGQVTLRSDATYGARMLLAEFGKAESKPWVELTSRIQTRNRAVNWGEKAAAEDAESLKFWTRSTTLLPTDGIVRKTALDATRGAKTDVEKARAIYEWVVAHAWREPKVRGCGEGDIRTMLETGNLGGKCADLNALFVGMCRAVGVPARDVYGLRLVPSAFGYKELSGNPANLKGAQHCRAEVYLKAHGWVAADPADVAKVMRQETAEWIKDARHPVVAPVHRALFGQWEGNWLGWNMAHDLKLPSADGAKLGFLMYPVCETGGERLDSYSPDSFRYQITAKEVTV
jgi:transglutaminase-like putative cysteine protease